MNSVFPNALVKADDEDGSFRRSGFCCELLGAVLIVIEDAHANPPIAGRAGKARYFGGVISAREMVGEFGCHFFVGETADLNCPLAGRSGTAARFH